MKSTNNSIRQNKTAWTMIILLAVLGLMFYFVSKPAANHESDTADGPTVNLDSPMSQGEASAPVSLIEYSDFMCGYCVRFAKEIYPGIKKDYVDSGKVKLEFRPVSIIGGSYSQIAAEGAYCAADQDKFWQYHNTVFDYIAKNGADRQKVITDEKIAKAMSKTEIDSEKLLKCMKSDQHLQDVEQANEQARADGVNATPYVFVDGTRVNISSYTALSSLIEAKLKEK